MGRIFIYGVCSFWLLGLLLFACAEPIDGQKVFVESGCARCHELDGSGGSQGPPLEALSSKWTTESLEQFLIDPPAYVKNDARLQSYTDDYMTPMPKLEIEPARRKALVQFLLVKHP